MILYNNDDNYIKCPRCENVFFTSNEEFVPIQNKDKVIKKITCINLKCLKCGMVKKYKPKKNNISLININDEYERI